MAAEIVGATHERWDGRGYPHGLQGARIPIAARIVFVCDSFEAMVADRPFGEARSHADELERCAGGQLDPRVVEAFVTEVRLREVMAMQSIPRGPSASSTSRSLAPSVSTV